MPLIRPPDICSPSVSLICYANSVCVYIIIARRLVESNNNNYSIYKIRRKILFRNIFSDAKIQQEFLLEFKAASSDDVQQGESFKMYIFGGAPHRRLLGPVAR